MNKSRFLALVPLLSAGAVFAQEAATTADTVEAAILAQIGTMTGLVVAVGLAVIGLRFVMSILNKGKSAARAK